MTAYAKVLSARYDDGADTLRVFFAGGPPAFPSATRVLDSGRRILHCDDDGRAVRVDFPHASLGLALDGLPNAREILEAAAEVGIGARL